MKKIASLALLAAFCSAASSQIKLDEKSYSDFDHFVLAVSWQPSFCQSKYQGMASQDNDPLPSECNVLQRVKNKRDYLSVHGLWPSLPKTLANEMLQSDKKEDLWRDRGCAVLQNKHKFYGNKEKCLAPQLNFSQDVADMLLVAMPGANSSSCLDRYEYAKHGVCFGYDPNQYFKAMVTLLEQLKLSQLAELIESRYGEFFSKKEGYDAIKASLGDKAQKSFEFVCSDRNGKKYLDEIRVTLLRSALSSGLQKNGSIFVEAVADQDYQKKHDCGESIYVDTRGF